jgi:hypothetical protein
MSKITDKIKEKVGAIDNLSKFQKFSKLKASYIGYDKGALIVSILQFSAMKKSMSSQSVQQTYATITQVLFNNLNSKEYLQMSQESPVVSKYYSLVDNPQ